ncbi:MAG TPA: hypothetical protein VM243_18915 [Phycisphaerae bacterium]|nr:hypothetical protein [Phycisphaerae bacterium]
MSAESTEGGSGAPDASATMGKRLQELDAERARLTDLLAAAKRDLETATKQATAGQARLADLEAQLADQRPRLKQVERERQDLEAELVAKNTELHQAQVENERLLLQSQRAELHVEQDDRADRLAEGQRDLGVQIEKGRADADQLRADKDAEIEALKDELHKERQRTAEGADKVLAELWDRLAQAKPKLAEGHLQPNVQAAQRLVDTFIELAKFVDDAEKTLRVFLGKYTKDHPAVKVPWDAFAKSDEFYKTVHQIVTPKGGKPAGLAKMRLRVLYAWIEATMLASDSAIESIASELETQLQGTLGVAEDPNRKVKDYLRDDGHHLLMQRIRELRNQRVAETYGHSREKG